MLEKPKLADQTIIDLLHHGYGVRAITLEFLPIGNDSSAWVYRVETQSTAYFLKVRNRKYSKHAFLVPRFLNHNGITRVVAPLPTLDDDVWHQTANFVLILYPYILGEIGMSIGLSNDQWQIFGKTLKRVHSVNLSAELLQQIPKETFVSRWQNIVNRLQTKITDGGYDDQYQEELAAFWKAKQAEITEIIDRTQMLGQQLQRKSLKLVLCHGDIHTANILVDQAHQLHIVDWDETVLAPKERDLMFITGTPKKSVVAVSDTAETQFYQGYGGKNIDMLALAYYRYEWVVQEIGDYGERVFLQSNVGAKTKADAVQEFRWLFQPGDVVEAAYMSEQKIE